MRIVRALGMAMLVATGVALAGGCESGGKTTTPESGGIGAVIGKTAGDEHQATLVGKEHGQGVGYVIGDHADREKARRLSEVAGDEKEHYEVGRLGGTRWKLLDLQPYGRVPSYREKTIYFKPNGRVVTTTLQFHGNPEVVEESYRVVGNVVVVAKPGYMINAKFWFDGEQLILDGADFRAILLRVPT